MSPPERPIPGGPEGNEQCTANRRNVCNCFQITFEDMQRILVETNGASLETLKRFYKVGTRCTSCEYEIKDLIAVFREEQEQGHLAVGNTRIPLGLRLGSAYRRFKSAMLRRLTMRRYGIFVIRRDTFESSLVLSNLQFPEDIRNANGKRVSFRTTLFDAGGRPVARSGWQQVGSDRSREFTLSELFPSISGEITGMVLLDYRMLLQVGSLRPYCCFNFLPSRGGFSGRWHYHDKFGQADYNGHYHCNHPLFPGQDCWIAISNCLPRPYDGKIRLRLGSATVQETAIHVPAHGSAWLNIADTFGIDRKTALALPNSLLWFDSPQRLMVWFFWHKESDGVWIVQHH